MVEKCYNKSYTSELGSWTRSGWSSIHTSDLALDYIILFVFADVEALMLQ